MVASWSETLKQANLQTFSESFAKNSISKSKSMPVKEHAKIKDRDDVTQLGRVPGEVRHQLIFARKHANLAELERIVHDVSNPMSVNFGQHMTRKEIDALTANPASSEHILRFLEYHGATIVSRSTNDAYITAEAPMAKWEELLDTEFFYFSLHGEGHPPSSKLIRSLKYSVPSYLDHHVSSVLNAVEFPNSNHRHRQAIRKSLESVKKEKEKEKEKEKKNEVEVKSVAEDGEDTTMPYCLNSADLAGYVCPSVLNYIYDMRNNTGNGLTSQAVYESIGQTMSPTDLTKFQQLFDLPIEAIAADIGGHVSDNACVPNYGGDCGEANLDIQYMMGMSQSIPTTYYYSDASWLAWITEVADMADPPRVISISYGEGEQYITDSIAQSFQVEAMSLAAMGVTVLASSGDDGAPGPNARQNGKNCGYGPQFPASCPYVTAVGGTQVIFWVTYSFKTLVSY